jgi:hypothetical protein
MSLSKIFEIYYSLTAKHAQHLFIIYLNSCVLDFIPGSRTARYWFKQMTTLPRTSTNSGVPGFVTEDSPFTCTLGSHCKATDGQPLRKLVTC